MSDIRLAKALGNNALAKPNITIADFCEHLRQQGIQGLDFYQQKLLDNEKDPRRLQDLACEGKVALAFAKHGWTISMRDSPDLEAKWNGIELGIEVKHFRYKQSHDPVEDAALSSPGEVLARVPLLSETEGHEEAWDQMYRFAAKNAHQYAAGKCNVIFFWCSTQAHCDGTLRTAANIYDETLARGTCDSLMKNLSAMMISSVWSRYGHGSVFLQSLPHSRNPLTPELFARLNEIRES